MEITGENITRFFEGESLTIPRKIRRGGINFEGGKCRREKGPSRENV